MARPVKSRRVDNIPAIQNFAPVEALTDGVPVNTLLLEELEALRLKDLLGLEQEECAEKMEVSRPTFQRILISAREKVADSLINGKAVTIEGGNFMCASCGYINGVPESGSANGFCRRNCRRRGQGPGVINGRGQGLGRR